MSDIASIATIELIEDLRESVADIEVCQRCLAYGVTHHRDGLPVQQRLDTNRKIIAVINAELKRRGQAV